MRKWKLKSDDPTLIFRLLKPIPILHCGSHTTVQYWNNTTKEKLLDVFQSNLRSNTDKGTKYLVSFRITYLLYLRKTSLRTFQHLLNATKSFNSLETPMDCLLGIAVWCSSVPLKRKLSKLVPALCLLPCHYEMCTKPKVNSAPSVEF